MFRPGHRAGVFIWEKFQPVYRDIGRKNRDLGNGASPAPHMNTSIFLQRKEWWGEISETKPFRLIDLSGEKIISNYNACQLIFETILFCKFEDKGMLKSETSVENIKICLFTINSKPP